MSKKGARVADLGEVLTQALEGVQEEFSRWSQVKGEIFPLPLPHTLGQQAEGTFFRCIDRCVEFMEDAVRTSLVGRLTTVVEESPSELY